MNDPLANALPGGIDLQPQAPKIGKHMDPAAARKTAEDFEAFYLNQTFETMFSGIKSDGMFGGGSGEEIYRSLLLQQYSKVAAKSGGFGIADAVQREMLKLQEVQ